MVNKASSISSTDFSPVSGIAKNAKTTPMLVRIPYSKKLAAVHLEVWKLSKRFG